MRPPRFRRCPSPSLAPPPLRLRLDSAKDSLEDLEHIRALFYQYPGLTPVIFQCQAGDGTRLELSAGPRFKIDPHDDLIGELSPWL